GSACAKTIEAGESGDEEGAAAAVEQQQLGGGVTVIVPAYNPESSVGEAIRSLHAQTHPPAETLVVDDCSTVSPRAVAAAFGVQVLRPKVNTGSKAGAQSFALEHVKTEFTLAIDADTTLAADAIEKLGAAFLEPGVVAASGFVLPRRVRSPWERGRY